MSSSDENIILFLNNATMQLNRYLSVVIYLFGTIGNILNIIILSKRQLRSNSCAFLFLLSSIASLLAILSGLTNRAIAGWTTDLTLTIDSLCQFRGFILFTSRMIALWLILLATLERWLLSCTGIRRRQLRTSKNIRRGAVLIIILSIISNIPIIYCFQANIPDTPVKCYGKTSACRIYTDMSYGCGTILIPTLLMTYLSLMIISNVHRTRRHIAAVNPATNNIRPQRRKKKDRQLSMMLLIQVFFIVILTFPQAIQKLYSTLTLDLDPAQKSFLRVAIENFVFNVVVLFTYLASGLPFYIYTLSGGSIFRNACWQMFRTFSRKILCQTNEN